MATKIIFLASAGEPREIILDDEHPVTNDARLIDKKGRPCGIQDNGVLWRRPYAVAYLLDVLGVSVPIYPDEPKTGEDIGIPNVEMVTYEQPSSLRARRL